MTRTIPHRAIYRLRSNTFVRRAVLSLAMAIAGMSCGKSPPVGRTAEQYSFPEYPPLAAKMRVDADLTCLVQVTAAGDVSDVKIVVGSPGFFDQYVEDALREWKYNTAEKPSVETVHVAFRLVPAPERGSDKLLPAVIFNPPGEVIVIEEISNKIQLSD